MKARELIDSASFEPPVLKVLGQAFDEAWSTIARNFGTEPHEMDAARLKLAKALLSIANNECRDVESLKKAALIAMALDYRTP